MMMSCLRSLVRTSPHRVRGAPRGLHHPSVLGLKVWTRGLGRGREDECKREGEGGGGGGGYK